MAKRTKRRPRARHNFTCRRRGWQTQLLPTRTHSLRAEGQKGTSFCVRQLYSRYSWRRAKLPAFAPRQWHSRRRPDSNGSSTAETTQSDSSQDTVPQKCDAPMPEVYRPQKKGTRFLISPKFHLEVADRFKVKCSVESSERFRACDTYAFTLIACSRLLRTPNHQRLHAALNFNQEIQKSCPFPSHCIDAVKCNDRY